MGFPVCDATQLKMQCDVLCHNVVQFHNCGLLSQSAAILCLQLGGSHLASSALRENSLNLIETDSGSDSHS